MSSPHRHMRRLTALLLVLPLMAALSSAMAAPLEPLDIKTAGGLKHFEVEVMRTSEERERGLMFRRDLAPDRGMLFLFEKPQILYFWMKNTYLPLDIIFVGKNNKVVSIAKNAEPLSERILSSGQEALNVVEINAGLSDTLGIAPGDEVIYPAKPK